MDGMFTPLSAEETAAASVPPKSSPKTPIVPVPADAPAMRFKHPEHGEPTRSWAYHDADGQLVGYVSRWDHDDASGRRTKTVLPVTYCDIGNGKRAWRSKGLPTPRPLLGLPEILANPDKPVIVCEGEKTRDAGRDLFPDAIATTPAHGSKSPQLTDFAPLAGRTVVIVPDHDEPERVDDKGRPLHPGRDFADRVCGLARAAGAAKVLHLTADALAHGLWIDGELTDRGEPVPDGWDLADAISEGWTAERIADVVTLDDLAPYLDADERRAETGEDDEAEEDDGRKFRLVEHGVEKRTKDRESGQMAWRWFCSHLDVLAETRSGDGDEWGRLLSLRDRDGRTKRWSLPMSMLAGDGSEYRSHLLSLGLEIAPGKFGREALHEYVSMTRPRAKARCVGQAGWADGPFLFSNETKGARQGEEIILQVNAPVDFRDRTSGTLASWQQHVAAPAVGNSRLVLAPLLYPTRSESGGFHFKGNSSTGKSTTLIVAGSVWGGGGVGGYLRSWRSTSNGLEGVAAAHNDMLLCLDEMSQVSPIDASAIAYMLANGQGKIRATRNGGARKPAEWRLLFLSSGEVGLAEKINEDGRGRRAAAGQEVRIVDIAADAGAGMGLFEELHGASSADAFSRQIVRAALADYGHPARAFVQALVEHFDKVEPAVANYVDGFREENIPAGADGQVRRVAARFGLVAAAGEMAREFGILPWPEHEATRAAERCFRDWLGQRGGSRPAEATNAIATVRRFIEQHGTSRFEAIGELAPHGQNGPIDQRIVNRAGFRRLAIGGGGAVEYLFLPETWKSEVCHGLDPIAAAKTLGEAGFIEADRAGKLQSVQRLPGLGPTRCYVIGPSIMGDAKAGH